MRQQLQFVGIAVLVTATALCVGLGLEAWIGCPRYVARETAPGWCSVVETRNPFAPEDDANCFMH